jgi:hypothetical protein
VQTHGIHPLCGFAAGRRFPISVAWPLSKRGDNRMEEKLPPALPRDVPDYHKRQAAHFRALASTAITVRVKTRPLREAEEHEEIVYGELAPITTDEL